MMSLSQMALIPFPGPSLPYPVLHRRMWDRSHPEFGVLRPGERASSDGRVVIERRSQLEDGDVIIWDWGSSTPSRAIYRYDDPPKRLRSVGSEPKVKGWHFVNYMDPRPKGEKAWDQAFDQMRSALVSVLGSEIAQLALSAIGFIPGVGTAIAASAAALAALGRGESLGDAVLAGARGAIPGGPLAQAGFDAGVGLIKGEGLDIEQALALAPLIEEEFGPEAAQAFTEGTRLAAERL